MGAIHRRLSKLEKRAGISGVLSMGSRGQPFRRLGKSSMFQDAPDPFGHVSSLALEQVSDEHLALLMGLSRDWEAGLCRALSENESAALAAHEATLQAIGAASQQSRKSG